MTAPPFRASLRDASAFFAEEGVVYETYRRISDGLAAVDIEHAAFGEIAFAAHGFRRFRETVEIVVTRSSLTAVQKQLAEGRYSQLTATRFRDDATGVEIRFAIVDLCAGDVVELDGRPVVRLEKMIELKLASGLAAAPRRLRDLGDVQDLIAHLNLPLELAEKLDPFVRDTYIQYWHIHQSADGADRE